MSKYKRIYQEFLDLEAGLQAAKQWYREMKDTVDSLDKNVETFVNNRRSEGAQLLSQIEADRASSASGQADRERERLRGLMERMSMDPSAAPSTGGKQPRSQSMYTTPSTSTRYPTTNITGQYQIPSSPPPLSAHPQSAHPSFGAPQNGGFFPPPQQQVRQDPYLPPKPTPQPQGAYNPAMHPPVSPPPNQTTFAQNLQYGRPIHQQPNQQQYVPPGYVPPPPPPGPPPLGPQQTFPQPGVPGNDYTYGNQRSGQPSSGDPWAGLNAWK